MAHQQFSPPGNLQQFFITRRDNVSACSVLLPPPTSFPATALTRVKVSCRYLCFDTGERRTSLATIMFSLFTGLYGDALAEIRWDGIMRHYRLYRIGDLPCTRIEKSCRSDIPASGADFNAGDGKWAMIYFLRGAHAALRRARNCAKSV